MKIQVTTPKGIYTLHISKGNSKIGRDCWNVSKRPVTDCPKGVPCAKGCYALKSFRMYKNVAANWTDNGEFCEADLVAYHDAIRQIIREAKRQPVFFRWHVAGDVSSVEEMMEIFTTASEFPQIKFLVFSKRYDAVNKSLNRMAGNGAAIPANLSVVFSAWPGMPLDNPFSLPVAYMQDGSETRIPSDAIHCPGNCETCGMCWNLPLLKRDVYFSKH